MKLTINDRLSILVAMPKSFSFKTMNMIDEIAKKLKIGDKEGKKIGLKVTKVGNEINYHWEDEQVKVKEKDFELLINEIDFLKKQIDRMDKLEKITFENRDIFLKIKKL